jgi:TonB family protein
MTGEFRTAATIKFLLLVSGFAFSTVASGREVKPLIEIQEDHQVFLEPGSCKPPKYPLSSLRYGETGTVQLQLVINTQGEIVDATITRSSGFKALDNATVKAFRLCKYHPALEQGQAVESSLKLRYIWKLE